MDKIGRLGGDELLYKNSESKIWNKFYDNLLKKTSYGLLFRSENSESSQTLIKDAKESFKKSTPCNYNVPDEMVHFYNSLHNNILQEVNQIATDQAALQLKLDEDHKRQVNDGRNSVTIDFNTRCLSCHLDEKSSFGTKIEFHDSIFEGETPCNTNVFSNSDQCFDQSTTSTHDINNIELKIQHNAFSQCDDKEICDSCTQTKKISSFNYMKDIEFNGNTTCKTNTAVNSITIDSEHPLYITVDNNETQSQLKIVLSNENEATLNEDSISDNIDKLFSNYEFNRIVSVGDRIFNIVNECLSKNRFHISIFDLNSNSKIVKNVNALNKNIITKINDTVTEKEPGFNDIYTDEEYFKIGGDRSDDDLNSHRHRKQKFTDDRLFSPTLLSKMSLKLMKVLPFPQPAVYSSVSDYNRDPFHKKTPHRNDQKM